jgi:alpha-maltose-1-phosphate synthase
MRILFLAEGDAETAAAWSGSAQQVLHHLRLAGHSVTARNVDLTGWERWLGAASVLSADRMRLGVKYRLLPGPSDRRSRRASKWIAESRGKIDLIFQIGASFRPLGRGDIPYVLYCDSNIGMARDAIASGHSPAARLTGRELDSVWAREAEVYQRASAVFAISEGLRKSFVEQFLVAPDRARAVHAGPNFDVSRIPVRSSERRGPPTILFVGAQFERKGGPSLLAAFKLVRDRVPDARLIVVGPDQPIGQHPGVECLGYLRKDVLADSAQLVGAYARADVFCLPTLFEPFGIVFLEAMFFGLPCVGTKVGAVPEMIENGVSGFTVSPGVVPELADRLTALLLNREQASRMGAAGHHRATAYFTWPATVGRMLETIEQLDLVKAPRWRVPHEGS